MTNNPGSSASKLNAMLSKVNLNCQSEAITNMQEVIELFENNDISSFNKMRIFYENTNKLKFANLPLTDIKRKIRFITAICYNVLNGKYADLLNNILKDKNIIYSHREYTGEMTGFREFYELLVILNLEMAIYNVDNKVHIYNFNNIEDVQTMVDVIKKKHDDFVSEIKAIYN